MRFDGDLCSWIMASTASDYHCSPRRIFTHRAAALRNENKPQNDGILMMQRSDEPDAGECKKLFEGLKSLADCGARVKNRNQPKWVSMSEWLSSNHENDIQKFKAPTTRVTCKPKHRQIFHGTKNFDLTWKISRLFASIPTSTRVA